MRRIGQRLSRARYADCARQAVDVRVGSSISRASQLLCRPAADASAPAAYSISMRRWFNECSAAPPRPRFGCRVMHCVPRHQVEPDPAKQARQRGGADHGPLLARAAGVLAVQEPRGRRGGERDQAAVIRLARIDRGALPRWRIEREGADGRRGNWNVIASRRAKARGVPMGMIETSAALGACLWC
jgi:hypothetical protein